MKRNLQPELMDDPDLDSGEHALALAGLRRLNWFSGAVGSIWKSIVAFASQHSLDSVRILDVACGGGDIALGIMERADRQANFDVDILGLDISPVAVEIARQRCSQRPRSTSVATFEVADVLTAGLPADRDIVFSSLFLHHLNDSQAQQLLSNMHRAAGRLMIVNDLLRSRRGYWLAQFACRTLSRSRIVQIDGPRSVEGAFSIDEVRQMCEVNDIQNAKVERCWPCRFMLTCEKQL